MAIMAKDSGGRDFKPIPQGAHLAICTMVVDLGMQEGFSGKPQRKVYLLFEVPDERVEFTRDGAQVEGPAIIGKTYTLSLSEKANLRKDLESWRGKSFTADELAGFDISKLLGVPCQIGVTHDKKGDKTYANISTLMGVSRDQKERAKALKPESELIEYSVDSHHQATLDKLPKWIKEAIANRIEDGSAHPAPATAGGEDFDDDIPFDCEDA